MINKAIVPDIKEVPFSFDELFFSRTDERGIILSGNSVFQRVSLYSWEELLKKPHNLIRHPDMPKGVFHLFWETLKKGEPIGAYVKNRAKDGRYYWVYAIATPINGGFLSVRLKPSSDLLNIVEQEYKTLVNQEINNKLSTKDSAAKLLERLKELGFNSYQEFMSVALSKEMEARNKQLGILPDRAIKYFNELMLSAQSLLTQASNIFLAYEKNQHVPLNLRIQAAQLGEPGATIGVISNNYNIISTEIKEKIGEFTKSAQKVYDIINDVQFLTCTAKIQGEVVKFFECEADIESISKKDEMLTLDNQQKAYRLRASRGLNEIVKQAIQFQQDCQGMKMLASGLEVTRVMGKVESARLVVSDGGLNELINDLELLQQSISNSLKEIEQMNRSIEYNIDGLLREVAA